MWIIDGNLVIINSVAMLWVPIETDGRWVSTLAKLNATLTLWAWAKANVQTDAN